MLRCCTRVESQTTRGTAPKAKSVGRLHPHPEQELQYDSIIHHYYRECLIKKTRYWLPLTCPYIRAGHLIRGNTTAVRIQEDAWIARLYFNIPLV